MKWFLLIVTLLCIVLLLRTFLLPATAHKQIPTSNIQIDLSTASTHLAQAISIPTISFDEQVKINLPAILTFHSFLQETYPLVHNHLTRKVINTHSLLYHWEGLDKSKKAILLVAHFDVVPVNAKKWQSPPFKGYQTESHTWGRGSLDNKSSLISIFEAIQFLLEKNFKPQRSIYLALGHDEEIGGKQGALKIAQYLEKQKIPFQFVLDEGSIVTEGTVPGIKAPVALIGLGEKGFANFELKIESQGGHSSMPPSRSIIGLLGEQIHLLEQNPMPAYLDGIPLQMFQHLAPHMSFFNQVVFANSWLFKPLILNSLEKNPATNALIRTTLAATLIKSGVKANIIPKNGSVIINARIHPHNRIEDVKKFLNESLNLAKSGIHLSIKADRSEPSTLSPSKGPEYKFIERAISHTFPKAIIAPSLVLGATDSRHFQKLTPHIFRFLPILIPQRELSLFHGVNERISKRNLQRMIRFYVYLLENSR